MDTWRLKQDLMLWIPMACKFLALKCVHVSGAIETLSDFLIAHVFLIAQMSPSSMSRVLVCVHISGAVESFSSFLIAQLYPSFRVALPCAVVTMPRTIATLTLFLSPA